MSDRLRDALRAMAETLENSRGPVVYLHDPTTGQPFAALVDLAVMGSVEAFKAWDPVLQHDHCEGDEDEYVHESAVRPRDG